MNFWKHGRYIDYQSLPHFLAGVTAACSALHFGRALSRLVAPFLALTVFYEWLELRLRTYIPKDSPEPFTNKVSDVALGLAGYVAVWLFRSRLEPLSRRGLASVTAGYLFTNAVGWLGWRLQTRGGLTE